jgi:hypothetical protein
MIGGNAGDEESAECVEVRGGEDTAAAMFVERPSQQLLPFKRATRMGVTDAVRP